MKRDLSKRVALALAGPLAVLTVSWSASAAPCAAEATPIYITGSSAVKPFVKGLAAALAGASPKVTLVYKGAGSCTGVDAILNGTKMTGTASYWDTAAMELTCDLEIAGTAAD